MGMVKPGAYSGAPRVGTSGGAVRIATGYGFQRTLEQVERLAEALLTDTVSTDRRWKDLDPLWKRLGDTAFLRALQKIPLRGRDMIEAVVQRSPEAELLAFLSDTATFTEAVSVMKVVPKLPMIQTLCRL